MIELGDIRTEESLSKQRNPSVTILGSFRYKSDIDQVIAFLEERSIDVKAPKPGVIVGEVGGFRLIEGDKGDTVEDASELERSYLESLANSDLGIIVNPNSYNGNMSAFEMGFATSLGIPLCSINPLEWNEPAHPTFQTVSQSIPTIAVDLIPLVAKNCLRRSIAVKKPTYRVDERWNPIIIDDSVDTSR